jgi:hypothetical protein
MMRALRHIAGNRRRGFALIITLLVLMALLVLCTPFLLSARNADRASAELADRVEARILLDAAARHARAGLRESHPALDATPYFDTAEELAAKAEYPADFLRPADPNGPMWQAEVNDLSAQIDLNSAPPQVFANLMGLSTRLTAPLEPDAKELPLSSVLGLEPSGYVWIGGELVRYQKVGESGLEQFVRGLNATTTDWSGGPKPSSPHGAGTAVIDQRAFAIPTWRTLGADGDFRALEEMEQLRECARFALASATEGSAGAQAFEGRVLTPLFDFGAVHSPARTGSRWQFPVRVLSPILGGQDGRLSVSSTRWINAGTTVQIYDGTTRETALVSEVTGEGVVYLDRVLANDYLANQAELRVLARVPVNLNTASRDVLIALFNNLQLVGKNARVNKDEAQTLADVIIESRPLEGFEDFLRRVVLPACGIEALPEGAPSIPRALAGGRGFLDELDALAVYTNGLNANDSTLAYSTMPYCFRSSDVYELELRATVNAPAGVERFTLVREQIEVIAPQQRLLQLWARQEDFDEELRLSRAAPLWMSAPSATSPWDGSATPPSRLRANWGSVSGRLFLPGEIANSGNAPEDMPKAVEHTFASRTDTAWTQLWPARVPEVGRRRGRIIHFDSETRDPEGRYLPDEPVNRAASDNQVRWVSTGSANTTSLMMPAAWSLWVKLRSTADACLFDIGANSSGSDRIALLIERGDLVLRVFDGTGDHAGTPQLEAGEARYALAASATDPGLPLEVWQHISIDVRGTRPDQITLLVNGMSHGVRTPGLTRLVNSINASTTTLAVESVEGFPAQGVARIGDELVEYSLGAGNVLDCTPVQSGLMAGFGGRLARERTIFQSGVRVPQILLGPTGDGTAPANVGNHPAGTAVQVFGYSMALKSKAPSGQANLPQPLGTFAVGVVRGTQGGNPTQGGEPLSVVLPLAGSLPLGYGLDGPPSQVTGLDIAPADPQTTQAQLMASFQPTGGYVLLVQRALGRLVAQPQTPGQPGQPTDDPLTTHNVRIGGAEVLWYTGVQGNRLLIDPARRGNTHGFATGGIGREPRAFVFNWNDSFRVQDPSDPAATVPVDPDTRLEWDCFAIPISIAAPGASSRFLDPVQSPYNQQVLQSGQGQYQSEYAQITRAQNEFTEWVRYDEIKNDQLVRCIDRALREAFVAATQVNYDDEQEGTIPVNNPGGGGGTPGGGGGTPGGGGGGGGVTPAGFLEEGKFAAAAAPMQQSGVGGAYWIETLGAQETSEGPLSRAISSALQFRGVMGTYSHAHPASTPLLPVIRVHRRAVNANNLPSAAEPDAGRVGAGDGVFFVESDPSLLGNPAIIQRAFQPLQYLRYQWRQQGPNQLVAVDSGLATVRTFDIGEVDYECMYVGLREALPVPYAEDLFQAGSGSGTLPDIRLRQRVTHHPSGELPRLVTSVRVGGALAGGNGSAVPSAVIDEIVFGDILMARAAPGVSGNAAQGAAGWLAQEYSSSTGDLYLAPSLARAAWDLVGFPQGAEYLNEWPEDAGLIRAGDEILCYQERSPVDGRVTLATNGRALLGTQEQPHHAHETVTWLEDWAVTVLAADLAAGDAQIQLKDATDFPNEGTLLIDTELIHYTRMEGTTLFMPRGSSEPGARDGRGEALFRGRFGSLAAAHAAGTPVILFPFRYWDRWAERADAPELACFEFSLDHPSAWWESFFFRKEDVDGARIGVLRRSGADAPWDADPEQDARVMINWDGEQSGAPIPVGLQSDRLSFRAFVEYTPQAFDAQTGLRHGWRQTPRLVHLGAFYFAPNTVLRSLER